MLKERIGIILFCLGVCTADSERLIVPALLAAMGLWLMKGLINE